MKNKANFSQIIILLYQSFFFLAKREIILDENEIRRRDQK